MTKVEAIIYFDAEKEQVWIDGLIDVINDSVRYTTGHQHLGRPRSLRKKESFTINDLKPIDHS